MIAFSVGISFCGVAPRRKEAIPTAAMPLLGGIKLRHAVPVLVCAAAVFRRFFHCRSPQAVPAAAALTEEVDEEVDISHPIFPSSAVENKATDLPKPALLLIRQHAFIIFSLKMMNACCHA